VAQKTISYKGHNFAISYELLYPTNEPTIAILHGWGSNKSIMKQAFGKTLLECKHLYIDLPGFGNSSEPPFALDAYDYQAILELFFQTLNIQPQAIIGHSFGGKVATLLNPPLLVLLSSAGIIEPKPLKVKAKIALFKLLKPFGVAKLRSFFVANDAQDLSEAMYATFKNVIKEDFHNIFENFTNDALVFWGDKDTATSPQSGKTIAKLLDAPIKFYDGDHYFFLHHAQDIAQRINHQCNHMNK